MYDEYSQGIFGPVFCNPVLIELQLVSDNWRTIFCRILMFTGKVCMHFSSLKYLNKELVFLLFSRYCCQEKQEQVWETLR